MKRGFTLIEMLISIVIFSFIVALATYSFRFYTDIVKKIVMPYPQQVVKFSKLEDAVRSIFYFTGERKNTEGKLKFFTYFYGNKDEMKFITAEPLNPNYGIAVCKLYLDNNTLVLEESPVYSKYNDYKRPSLTPEDEKKLILMSDVSSLEFTYFTGEKKTDSLKEDVPNLIEMKVKQKDKSLSLYFKVKSEFRKKRDLMRFFYAPF